MEANNLMMRYTKTRSVRTNAINMKITLEEKAVTDQTPHLL